MKYIPYIYIGAFTFLIACSSEERITTTDSNEEPSGPIELSAGIAEGNSKATTRTGAEDNHASHQALTSDTKIALRVSGTWTEHGESPYTVVKTTTATVGAETSSGSKHNSLTCSPILYWDDYGSADLANATTGRTEGLTIYGAAVNGQTSIPTDLNSINGVTTASAWEGLSWTLPADQSSGWSTKDLLISNNVKAGTGDGTYKFAERASGKLLEFTHALSKITVILTAGDGFVDKNSDTYVDFANDPEVLLTSNDASTSNAEWACMNGIVNITTGTVTLTGTSSSGDPAVITMWQASSTGHVVTKEALVMPGSHFTADNAIIARINADGNIYYVTAQNIRAKMYTLDSSTNYKTEAGKNYIINITVNKTDIVVTATIANWTNISADEVAPVINVSGDLGGSAVISANNTFSFYRSSIPGGDWGYSNDESLIDNNYYKEESVLNYNHSTTTWTMSPVLYWPNHNTHYQFRAVWPRTVTTTTGDENRPRVVQEALSGYQYQLINVHNEAYTSGQFPSDLMIGRPDVPNEYQNCGNNEAGHTKVNLYTNGICAREGTINLKFKYMMSQVEVILTTTDTDYDKVKLDGAIVELVNVHKTGSVKLGSMEVVTTGTSPLSDPVRDTFGDYTLDYNSTSKHYHSAIVPQPLTFSTPLADGNLKFRIKIMNAAGDAVDDIYYADIQPIAVKVTGSSDAAAPVTNWESGKHYVYTLHLSKTEIKVTATLANWTEVTASQTVWF